MNLESKKLVDERQEHQSLKNSSTVNTMMILVLCGWVILQTWFQQRSLDYTLPEISTLLAGCILKIVLDVRQGNVYTEMNAKTKLTVILYVSAALIFAVLLGIRNYMLYDFPFWMISLVIIPVFLIMLFLFGAVHITCMRLMKRRLTKLEKELEKEESEE